MVTELGLPKYFETVDGAIKWVQAFPDLIGTMDDWWTRHPKGKRAHCQAMAAVNSAKDSLPSTDYLVLDLEYQWAQRRFDMVAAKRNRTADDPIGWNNPALAFVEVKSEYGACTGTSGICEHVHDYQDIIMARNGLRVQDIKLEFQDVIVQKKRLDLLNNSIPFKRFSAKSPELLIVLVDINPNDRKVLEPLSKVTGLCSMPGRLRFMRIDSPNYAMADDKVIQLDQLIT